MKKEYVLLLFWSFGYCLTMGQDNTRVFAFGHSLIDHRPPLYTTPSDETTVLHWLYLLSRTANHDFAGTGQYGFLEQHRNLPPIAQWGYDSVPPAWDSDFESFAEANFTDILITAANFIQWQGPAEPFFGQTEVSPISATIDIADWLLIQEDSIHIFIYENWPDMAGFLQNGFPPTAEEFTSYNFYTRNDFHDWWLEYQDSIISQRPNAEVKMIPVGPILSDLLQDTLLSAIPIDSLYEDDAPHGRPNIYFLASLITYSAVFAEPPPSNFSLPGFIHSDIRSNYTEVIEFIWNELLNFNLPSGHSRVFHETPPTTTSRMYVDEDEITFFPNPTSGQFHITGLTQLYNIDILDVNGNVHQNIAANEDVQIDLSTIQPAGLYFIRVVNSANQTLHVETILKHN